MIPRGAADGHVAAVGLLRRRLLSTLLVDGPHHRPHAGSDLAGLHQAVRPGQHLACLPQRVFGADHRRSRPRIAARRELGRALPDRRRILLRGELVETDLDVALPAAREESGEPQGTAQSPTPEHGAQSFESESRSFDSKRTPWGPGGIDQFYHAILSWLAHRTEIPESRHLLAPPLLYVPLAGDFASTPRRTHHGNRHPPEALR